MFFWCNSFQSHNEDALNHKKIRKQLKNKWQCLQSKMVSQSHGCMWPWTWENAGQLFRICSKRTGTQIKVGIFFLCVGVHFVLFFLL